MVLLFSPVLGLQVPDGDRCGEHLEGKMLEMYPSKCLFPVGSCPPRFVPTSAAVGSTVLAYNVNAVGPFHGKG
jgi:hypothetical protein